MSFSSDVKKEMMKHAVSTRHCMISELAGYIINLAKYVDDEFVIESEHEELIIRIRLLLMKLYEVETDVEIDVFDKKYIYRVVIFDDSVLEEILDYCKISVYEENNLLHIRRQVSPLIIKSACCQKTYIQTCFLCCGSVTDPDKSYHLEYASSHIDKLNQLKDMLEHFDIVAKITPRKSTNVLYVKEGQQIVDCLNILGAHASLLHMENTIVTKEFRNNINRQVNCEAANLIKSANAGSRQRQDILFLKEKGILKEMPLNIQEIAELRLEYPDISLTELGAMADPPVSKSCVNHRLRKIAETAEKYR